jgi:hypothetical protein
VDSTPARVQEKPPSSTLASGKPSSSQKSSARAKSKSSADGDSVSTSSGLPEEAQTPRHSLRKRTPNAIVQRLIEDESEFDDSDDDPNWEDTEKKKKGEKVGIQSFYSSHLHMCTK